MILNVILAAPRWLADRAWEQIARRVLPTVDDNLTHLDDVPDRLAGTGVPKRLDTFDGKRICERLDTDIAR